MAPPWLHVEEGWLRMEWCPGRGLGSTEVWARPWCDRVREAGDSGRLGEQAGVPARRWGCAHERRGGH